MKRTSRKTAKRRYTMRRRAEQQKKTRERIVAAAVELHEELGPRNATISAIAERAGVQRLTVYRHFPDDEALFEACSSHWLSLNPPPDPARWQDEPPGAAQTRAALAALYGYFRRTAEMWSAVYRDRDHVPALDGPMSGFDEYLDAVRDGLAAGWSAGSGAARGASKGAMKGASKGAGKVASRGAAHKSRTQILGHAVQFSTWRSLADQGLADDTMAALVVRWLEAV